MIGSTRNLRVFAYGAPADLRKGFDGLYGIVMAQLDRNRAASHNILDSKRCSCNALKARGISGPPRPSACVCRYVSDGSPPLPTDLRATTVGAAPRRGATRMINRAAREPFLHA